MQPGAVPAPSGWRRRRLDGALLGFALEGWEQSGIWVHCRADQTCPARLKEHLRRAAQPLLFGAAPPSLLEADGLAMVSSGKTGAEAELVARQTAAVCASSSMALVSGGAQGADQISMSAALDVGGVLADSLLRRIPDRQARNAIAEGRLILVAPDTPRQASASGAPRGGTSLSARWPTEPLRPMPNGAGAEPGPAPRRSFGAKAPSSSPSGQDRPCLSAMPGSSSLAPAPGPAGLAKQATKLACPACWAGSRQPWPRQRPASPPPKPSFNATSPASSRPSRPGSATNASAMHNL